MADNDRIQGAPAGCAGSSSDGVEGAPLNGGAHGEVWTPIRAALRYVTHKPWNRIPALTRTFMYNPVLACLAGGRNKARLPSAVSLPYPPVPCWQQHFGQGLCTKLALPLSGSSVLRYLR